MTPILQIRNLTTRFGEKVVHRNLSVDFRKGELVALMGSSGSGKSSLIDFIMDIEHSPCYDGELLWDGHPWNRDDLAYKVGFAPQAGGFLRNYTIGENVSMPLQYVAQLPRDVSLGISWAYMQVLGLPPSSFNQYSYMLSGGMLRRASIARALVLDQQLLILDEPLSGLDPVNAKLLVNLIRSFLPNKTIICVTHHFIAADRYAILNDGGLLIGTMDEVKQDKFGRKFMSSFEM